MKAAKSRYLTSSVALALLGMACNALADEPSSKGYIAFDAGLTLQQDVTVKDSGGAKASFDPGFRLDVGLGIGTRAPNSWGVELELGLIYNAMKPIEALDSEHVDVYEIPLLVNMIYTLPLHGPVTAYVGAGIGGVYGVFVGRGTSILGFSPDFTFGYQGMAGVEYAISERANFGIAYKFLGTTDHDMGAFKSEGTMTHCFLARLTLKF